MVHIATYYDQSFALSEYRCLLGVKAGHHNVKISMNKLVCWRIMKESRNKQVSTVYSLVDTLRIHIRYDEDDSLQDDLDRLFKKGNAVIDERNLKRSKRKNANNGGKERSQPKQRTSDDIEGTDEGNSESDEADDNSSAEV